MPARIWSGPVRPQGHACMLMVRPRDHACMHVVRPHEAEGPCLHACGQVPGGLPPPPPRVPQYVPEILAG